MPRPIFTQCGVGILCMIAFFIDAHAGSLARLTAMLPDVIAPPQGDVFWIAPSMRLNGLPMTIKGFQSRLRPEDVLAFYEEHSGTNSGAQRRLTRGEWRILGIRSARHLITVQARATIGGSEGTIAVSTAPERAKPAGTTAFPLPKTSRLLSRQEYDDAGIESEHLSLSAQRSAAVEAQTFADELERTGWQITRNQSLRATPRGVVIEAQRGAQQALLVLQPDRSEPAKTAVVVLWRKT